LRYHSIDPSGSRLSVASDQFAAQMAYLKRAGLGVVPLAEAVAERAGRHGRRLVALTFDDGYCNNLTEAVPLLQANGFPATFYISPGLLGGLPRWAGEGQGWLRIMSSNDVRGLGGLPQVDIGAHTLTHPRLDQLAPDEANREIQVSKLELSTLLGRNVTAFCYPHGAYTPETVELVGRSGFETACTVEPGTALRLKSRLEICRVYVSPTMTLSEFAAALTCASDWRLAVRRTLRRIVRDKRSAERNP
jgi:peptidoglycan/xylan/chitin deacetylase (PgdA/CDA1 family)